VALAPGQLRQGRERCVEQPPLEGPPGPLPPLHEVRRPPRRLVREPGEGRGGGLPEPRREAHEDVERRFRTRGGERRPRSAALEQQRAALRVVIEESDRAVPVPDRERGRLVLALAVRELDLEHRLRPVGPRGRQRERRIRVRARPAEPLPSLPKPREPGESRMDHVPRVRVRPRHPREDSVGPVAVETAPLRRTRLLLAFRSPSFRLLWAGQTVSLIGDGAFLVALGWRTTQLTGKSSSLALVLMVQGIGLLTTLLVGGALADRYPRRALMILSDTARCTTMVALTVADATGHLSLGVLLGLGFAFGLGDGFFYPAFGGIVPLVVETGELASANTLIGVSRQGAFVLGPALAGGIYGFAGPPAVFGFDAGTFLVSAALLVLARPREL